MIELEIIDLEASVNSSSPLFTNIQIFTKFYKFYFCDYSNIFPHITNFWIAIYMALI